MMHESKGEHIGKAPSLHLFHTAVRQCMGVFPQVHPNLYWQFMAVASFSGYFLAPPTWPGNDASMIHLVGSELEKIADLL